MRKESGRSHLFLLGLVVIILVLTSIIIIVLVVLVIELGKVILIEFLKGEGLAGEPVDRTGNQLLLDVLAKLVVQLQAFLNIGGGIIVLISRRLGRREEVEEGLSRDRLLDDAGLLGGCAC